MNTKYLPPVDGRDYLEAQQRALAAEAEVTRLQGVLDQQTAVIESALREEFAETCRKRIAAFMLRAESSR